MRDIIKKYNYVFVRMTLIVSLLTFTFLILTFPTSVLAQTTNLNAAFSYEVADKEASDGDILIYTDKGLVRSSTAFSNAMFGVVQTNPVVVIELDDNQGQTVISSGVANVNVIDANGLIKKGDYITSSATAGKGQRADKSGYMLGVALADLQTSSGQIPVALDIKYVDLYSLISPTASKFLKALDNILLASTTDPEKFSRLVRYVTAALIVMGAFGISFLTFSRSMTKSVEAIGRNPLAKNSIYFSLSLNVIVAVVTLIVGLITAFILIKL